jgi:chromosome segregation ATPase
MAQLAEENRKLLASLGGAPDESEAPAAPEADEVAQLMAENAVLRAQVEELKQQLDKASGPADANWEERQREYEALLEEKSEVIRSLHQKLQEYQDRPTAVAPREEELVALSEQLEQDRRQLQEDEEALMLQMRQMEMAMSRERAELARQRTELQRLHNEVRFELEQASRDSGLRDRLAHLQRRHTEMHTRKGAAPAAEARSEEPAPKVNDEPPPPPPKKSSSGLFRRLFGSGKA